MPRSWVEATEYRATADNVDRLLVDAELLLRLQLIGYQGRDWEKFASELAKYGIAVLGSWMFKGSIFARLQARGVNVPPLPQPGWDYEERSRIAEDTVVIALQKFRDTVLIPHRWKPDRGATLRTFFIGQCLIRFPNVYRQWLTERHRAAQRLDPFDEQQGWMVTDFRSPVEQQVVRDTRLEQLLDQAPDARTRRALVLLSEGHTQKEIAEDLGTTAKAVERLISRHRERLRGKENHGQAS